MREVIVGTVRYRIRCEKFRESGHRLHCYDMANMAKAEKACAEHNASKWERSCGGWVIEAQAVTEWGDPEDAEMCLYACGRTMRGQLL